MYRIEYTKKAKKDAKRIRSSNLEVKTRELIRLFEKDPFVRIPEYGTLTLNLKGCYSRRINRQHRLVYEVRRDETGEYKGVVRILSMWTHYESV